MRFICPEIVKQTKFALPSVFDLFKVSGEYTDLLDEALQRVYYTFKDELKNYYYGKATLYKYLSAITQSTTPMTIAEYAAYAGISITDNLGATIEAMDFYFQEAELLKLKTEMWLTIFGENGMYFYKPERLTTSQQITNFTIIEQITQETNDYGFFGETGYNLTASVLAGDTINIATIDDNLKTLICNCNRACADILVISSAQDADPLAYICDMKLTAGKVYLAVSKREVEGGYQYTMVKESKATFTFAQGDVTNPNVPSGEGSQVPVGQVSMFGGSSAPTGYLMCDGSAVNRTTYAALFAVIGTTFGAGDSSTTFNLPDFRGVFPKGAGTTNRAAGKDAAGNYYAGTNGAYATDQMQGHKTQTNGNFAGNQLAINGAAGGSGYWMFNGAQNITNPTGTLITDGTHGTPRTGNTTEPQSLGINFIIKY